MESNTLKFGDYFHFILEMLGRARPTSQLQAALKIFIRYKEPFSSQQKIPP